MNNEFILISWIVFFSVFAFCHFHSEKNLILLKTKEKQKNHVCINEWKEEKKKNSKLNQKSNQIKWRKIEIYLKHEKQKTKQKHP